MFILVLNYVFYSQLKLKKTLYIQIFINLEIVRFNIKIIFCVLYYKEIVNVN